MKTEIYKIELVLVNYVGFTKQQIIDQIENMKFLMPTVSRAQVVEAELSDNNPLMTGSGIQTYVEKLFSPLQTEDLEVDPQIAYWEAMSKENED